MIISRSVFFSLLCFWRNISAEKGGARKMSCEDFPVEEGANAWHGRIWFKSGGLLFLTIIIAFNTLADSLTTDCELSFILSVFSLCLFQYPLQGNITDEGNRGSNPSKPPSRDQRPTVNKGPLVFAIRHRRG